MNKPVNEEFNATAKKVSSAIGKTLTIAFAGAVGYWAGPMIGILGLTAIGFGIFGIIPDAIQRKDKDDLKEGALITSLGAAALAATAAIVVASGESIPFLEAGRYVLGTAAAGIQTYDVLKLHSKKPSLEV